MTMKAHGIIAVAGAAGLSLGLYLHQQEPAPQKLQPASRPITATAASTPSSNSWLSVNNERENSKAWQPMPTGQSGVPAKFLALVDSESRISPKTLPPASLTDYDGLLDEFHRTEKPSRKQRLAWVLAYVGDDRAVNVLTNVLLTTVTARGGLPVQEAQELGGIAFALGILARRYDIAFDFLVQGSDPRFWGALVGEEGGGDRTAAILAGSSLRGLALSQRSAVPAILARVRTNSSPAVARAIAGSLVDSAFIWSMKQQHSDAWDNGEVYRNGQEYMRLFVEWGQTPEGHDWRRWSQNAKGIPDRMIVPPTRP